NRFIFGKTLYQECKENSKEIVAHLNEEDIADQWTTLLSQRVNKAYMTFGVQTLLDPPIRAARLLRLTKPRCRRLATVGMARTAFRVILPVADTHTKSNRNF